MQGHRLVAKAATPMVAAVRVTTMAQLEAPTPCSAYDVRRLINHLLYWAPTLEGAAKDVPVLPPAASEADVYLVEEDWAGTLEAQIRRIITVWSDPEAWAGNTCFGASDPMPARSVGGMVMSELVLHGWDLAMAIDLRARWDDAVLDFVLHELELTADQGRQLGVYGPRVSVADDAPLLDRALGLSGRNPAWRF